MESYQFTVRGLPLSYEKESLVISYSGDAGSMWGQ